MIVCRSLTPKTLFEANLFSIKLVGQLEGSSVLCYSTAGALRR